MTEHIVSSATSAVTGELTRILFSGLLGRLDRRAVAADKKLRRLELLLVKIHSAVEASEKHAIENAWLLKWRDTLKEAAAEGDEVLAGFRERQRASTDAPARGPGDDDGRHQQEQERPSSSSSASASAAAARNNNAPLGWATETRLFSTDEGMERLNSAVERLEELSPEIGMFVKLLKLEILTPEHTTAENRARKRARPEDYYSMRHSGRATDDLEILTPEQKTPMDGRVDDATTQEERARSTLTLRLEGAFGVIYRSLKLADGRDLRGREWLARWASILREAKEQGSAILGAISEHRSSTIDDDTGACEQGAERDDCREDPELGSFVCGMESLAGEVVYFAVLVRMCPYY